MARCAHHRNQRVDVRNRVYVPFCPVLLVPHRHHTSFDWVYFRLDVRASYVLQNPQLRLQLTLLNETRDLLDPHALVNLAVHLKVQKLAPFNDSLPQWQQQNVLADQFVDLLYVLCRWVEVEVQVQVLDELDEWITVLYHASFHDFGQLVQIEWVVSVFMQVLVHDCSNCQVSQQLRWEKLNDRKAGLVVAQIHVLFEIFVSGLCEVNQGCQGQELLFLGVILLNQFGSLKLIKEFVLLSCSLRQLCTHHFRVLQIFFLKYPLSSWHHPCLSKFKCRAWRMALWSTNDPSSLVFTVGSKGRNSCRKFLHRSKFLLVCRRSIDRRRFLRCLRRCSFCGTDPQGSFECFLNRVFSFIRRFFLWRWRVLG